MRLIILTLCALVALGVFATMFLSIWSSRRGDTGHPSARQNVAAELVGAAIPCLIIVAAAIPAVIAISTSSLSESQALSGDSLKTEPLKPERPLSARSKGGRFAKSISTPKKAKTGLLIVLLVHILDS